jgi:hypothetical protein
VQFFGRCSELPDSALCGPGFALRSATDYTSTPFKHCDQLRGNLVPTILLIILILILLGALPTWPHSRNWGYYPSGGIGVVVVILIVLILMRMI